MRVLDIMHRDVVTVMSDDTLVDAARLLHKHGISAVVVIDGGAPIGILTERDFVHAVVEGDVQCPPVRWQEWRETARSEHAPDERHAHAMSFLTLERVTLPNLWSATDN